LVSKMEGKRVRVDIQLFLLTDISSMLTHSLLQVLLHICYIDLTRILAFYLVDYQGVATDIPILSCLILVVTKKLLEV
jgi:hypothetical protein